MESNVTGKIFVHIGASMTTLFIFRYIWNALHAELSHLRKVIEARPWSSLNLPRQAFMPRLLRLTVMR
jgi:hypothetical protein